MPKKLKSVGFGTVSSKVSGSNYRLSDIKGQQKRAIARRILQVITKKDDIPEHYAFKKAFYDYIRDKTIDELKSDLYSMEEEGVADWTVGGGRSTSKEASRQILLQLAKNQQLGSRKKNVFHLSNDEKSRAKHRAESAAAKRESAAAKREYLEAEGIPDEAEIAGSKRASKKGKALLNRLETVGIAWGSADKLTEKQLEQLEKETTTTFSMLEDLLSSGELVSSKDFSELKKAYSDLKNEKIVKSKDTGEKYSFSDVVDAVATFGNPVLQVKMNSIRDLFTKQKPVKKARFSKSTPAFMTPGMYGVQQPRDILIRKNYPYQWHQKTKCHELQEILVYVFHLQVF